tara:strand:- start:159 stop:458 length:300 start_codon:yes stop_codon:yes gene_type:complete
MIDKLNNITTSNAQNKRVVEESKGKAASSEKVQNVTTKGSVDSNNVSISSELKTKEMVSEAPINTAKVSAIKDAIARGDYPIDLDKVADALLQAYKDIK